ncbi:hypothetical protein JXJ21_26765 [candidate division KSB1 bacterium]|nr:hypothetical protein [candidate division KSB1 bacterium]
MEFKTAYLRFCILTFILMSGWLNAQDEIVEIMNEAKSAYQNKEYMEAASNLNEALRQINDLIIAELKSFLPESFDGWNAQKAEGGASGLSLLSELSVKRRYLKSGGKSVDVEIVSNAAKIPTIRMWFANPASMNAHEGFEISEINKFRCIERYDKLDRYAELNFIVGSSLLVVIRGFETKNTDDVKKFAEKIDLQKIENKYP